MATSKKPAASPAPAAPAVATTPANTAEKAPPAASGASAASAPASGPAAAPAAAPAASAAPATPPKGDERVIAVIFETLPGREGTAARRAREAYRTGITVETWKGSIAARPDGSPATAHERGYLGPDAKAGLIALLPAGTTPEEAQKVATAAREAKKAKAAAAPAAPAAPTPAPAVAPAAKVS